MKYNDGDLEKADYFLDCNWWEYYERLKSKGSYINWHNEQMKPKK